jgi:hypothetical protein
MSNIRLFFLKIVLVFALFLLSSCGGGDNEPGNDVSNNSDIELKYSAPNMKIGDTNEYIIGVITGEGTTDSLGIIGEIDASGDPTSVSSLVYITEDGTSSEILVGIDGLPKSVNLSDGSRIVFNNYSSNSVDVSVYNQSGELVYGPTIQSLDSSKIQEILSLYPFSNAAGKGTVVSAKVSNSDLLKWVGEAASLAGCIANGVAIVGSGGAATAVLGVQFSLSCGSTLVTAISYITDDPVDDIFATLTSGFSDSVLCPVGLLTGGSISSCITYVTNLMSYKLEFQERTPEYLVATPGDQHVRLQWFRVPDANGYFLYFSKDPDAALNDMTRISVSDNIYTHNGLTNLVDYYYVVQGVTSSGNVTKVSNKEKAMPYLIPAVPENVDATAGDGEVTISWDPVDRADLYIVYYGSSSGRYVGDYVTTETQYTVKGLANDAQYYFVVASHWYGIDSDISAEVSAIPVAAPPPPPPEPPALILPYIANGEVKLTWTLAFGADSFIVDSYTIYWGESSGQGPKAFENRLDTVDITHTFSDLTLDTTYYFTVTATDEGVESLESNEVSAVIIVTPGPPTNVKATPGNGEVILTWNTVSGADSYDVYWGASSGQGPAIFDNWLDNANAPQTISGLTNNTRYYFTVTSSVGSVESIASTEVNVVPVAPPVAVAPLFPLNDTGITWGANYSSSDSSTCTGETIAQQDCSNGRDDTDNDDTDGHAGFSFTKQDALGQGLHSSAPTWSCVRDNVSGLAWEVKTDNDDLHSTYDFYNWYNTDPATNGGEIGYADNNGAVCFGYDENAPATYCNTQAFVERVNNAGLCGAKDWRLPSKMELVSLINHNRIQPAIDIDYFPNTRDMDYWSSSPKASTSSNYVWSVTFRDGKSRYFDLDGRGTIKSVRLVRDSPLF